MKKRMLCGLLVLAMILANLTGCGKEEEDGGKATGGNEKVTLSVGIPQSETVKDFDDNAFTRYVEETLNMEIEFVYYSSTPSEYLQQLTLACAGNEELPDVLWGFSGMDRRTVSQYGEDGFFIDLTDLIDEYAVNYKEQLGKLTEEEQKMIITRGTSLVDGGFYGMPYYNGVDTSDLLQNMLVINQEWLDAVNMSVPTTVDELYAVLKAFKTQDPNGNGEADELPMYSNGGRAIWRWIMNAFVYYDSSNPLNVTDGEVWDPTLSDEFREGIEFINKLVEEGLLSELSFTSTAAEAKTLVSSMDGVAKVGIWTGHPQIATAEDCPVLEEYVALPALADETGKGGYVVTVPRSLLYGNVITRDCENPEAAMRFFDLFYVDETITRLRWGEKDVDWVYDEGPTCYGGTAYIRAINPSAGTNDSQKWGITQCGIHTNENYLTIDEYEDGWYYQIARLMGEHYAYMVEGKEPEEKAVLLNYTAEESDRRSAVNAAADSYKSQMINLFLTGGEDASDNKTWKTYIDNLTKYGVQDLVSLTQDAYDRVK